MSSRSYNLGLKVGSLIKGTKQLGRKGVDATKKAIHDKQRNIALNVIDDTKDKVVDSKSKMILKGAEEIVSYKYKDGGGVGDERNNSWKVTFFDNYDAVFFDVEVIAEDEDDAIKKAVEKNNLYIGEGGNVDAVNVVKLAKNSKYKNGGGVGENKIDFKNFTIAEFNSFVKSINAYGDIEVSVSVGNNVNKEGTYTKKIDLKKLKDLSMSLGDGKEISVVTGSENIYADVLVYDNNYDKGYKEYTISLFSKDDKKGLKSIVNAIIEKFKNGGGVKKMKKGARLDTNWVGNKTKENWGKHDLYEMYSNNLDLCADLHDYFKQLLEDSDEYYTNEMKNNLIEVLKTGNLKGRNGKENLKFAQGGATKGFNYSIGGL